MNLRRWFGTGAVVASLALLPFGVFAQCSMPGMSHGGHEGHETQKDSPAPKKKLSKEVRKVLEKDELRAELVEASVDDAAFMREMVKRIAADPHWRSVMEAHLASGGPADPGAPERPAETATPEHEHQHQH